MQIWMNLILALQMITAVVMIGLVLVQQGKGADMGASFGSGASGSLFGATGSANFLSRSTAVCAAVFFACTLTLAYMSNSVTMRAPSSGGTVLDRAATPASAAAASAAAQGAIPGAIPGAVPAAAPAAAPASAAALGVPAPVIAPAAAAPGSVPTK